ncbi:hypothetical protein KAR48_05475 [bacterium]|nr:hypothetical protein [bacterium]
MKLVTIVLGFILCTLIGYNIWQATLPYEELILPNMEISEELEIPPRPGVNGIEISGPIVQPIVFSIDASKPGMRSLDWRYLKNIDVAADVTIHINVDHEGKGTIIKSDFAGHTQAGEYIINAIKTWYYKPFMEGRIRIWFNLPSLDSRARLMIDTSQLERNASIPPHKAILFGRIHLIDKILPGEIKNAINF